MAPLATSTGGAAGAFDAKRRLADHSASGAFVNASGARHASGALSATAPNAPTAPTAPPAPYTCGAHGAACTLSATGALGPLATPRLTIAHSAPPAPHATLGPSPPLRPHRDLYACSGPRGALSGRCGTQSARRPRAPRACGAYRHRRCGATSALRAPGAMRPWDAFGAPCAYAAPGATASCAPPAPPVSPVSPAPLAPPALSSPTRRWAHGALSHWDPARLRGSSAPRIPSTPPAPTALPAPSAPPRLVRL